MTSRIDPITEAEWRKLRGKVRVVLDAKAYGTPEASEEANEAYGVIFDALWETGCHPSVLAQPDKNNVQLKQQDGQWTMVWRRPKTKRVCVMPITQELAEGLDWYIKDKGLYVRKTTRSILRVMRECAQTANLADVTPKTIRHTVAYILFKKHGPSVVKESLGVSDRVLQDYMALNAETRVRVIREGRSKMEGGT